MAFGLGRSGCTQVRAGGKHEGSALSRGGLLATGGGDWFPGENIGIVQPDFRRDAAFLPVGNPLNASLLLVEAKQFSNPSGAAK